eukprot:TRINITY_DN51225_c0_g1_i1.p1 TRINITY_DN51225_c0_g1~~TRINITY_DN51225_c0_g1_i1.p1  ORF type:complete len:355 (+),score=63.06 TRINITY_DN51225_c0_g1_i1:91-1155(+)
MSPYGSYDTYNTAYGSVPRGRVTGGTDQLYNWSATDAGYGSQGRSSYGARAATPPPAARGGGYSYAPSPPRDYGYSQFAAQQQRTTPPLPSQYDNVYPTRKEEDWSRPSTSWLSGGTSFGNPRTLYGPSASNWAQSGSSYSGANLIPAVDPGDRDRYCIVFDLDETLCYARAGPTRARPGVQGIVAAVQPAEVVVWTAGERTYAEGALRQLGFSSIVRHLVPRDSRWYRDGCTKDLRRLGRDLSRTLIIENTAQCIESNPENAILVPDYTGSHTDNVMSALSQVLRDLLQSGKTVQDFLRSSPLLARRQVRSSSSGRTFDAYTLRDYPSDDCTGTRTGAAPAYSTLGAYRPMRH